MYLSHNATRSPSTYSETFVSSYFHLEKLVLEPGQWVNQGDLIGYSGNTGCSSGPHLHFATMRLSNTVRRYKEALNIHPSGNDGCRIIIDRYGFDAPNVLDPWSWQAFNASGNWPGGGALSIVLWREGQARRPAPGSGGTSRAAIARMARSHFLAPRRPRLSYAEAMQRAMVKATGLVFLGVFGTACGGVSSSADAGLGSDGTAGTLEVVAISPMDSGTNVAITAPLVVEFSEAIDEASITPQSLRVFHGGREVEGTASVSGAEVTFQPSVQWHIAGTISVELTSAVTSTDGNALADSFSSSFVVVDGDWQTPVLVASDVGAFSLQEANLRGVLVYPYADANDNIAVVTYEPELKQFAASTVIEALPRAFRNPEAAVNDQGEAIVIWRGAINVTPEIVGWSRFDGTSWSAGQTQNVNLGGNVSVGLASDGTALIVMADANGAAPAESLFLTPAATSWSSPALLAPASNVYAVAPSGAGVQAIIGDRAAGGLASAQFSTASNTFASPLTIDAAGSVNFINLSQLGGGNTSFSWQRDGTAQHFARFDAVSNAWGPSTKLGDGAGGSQVCENSAGLRIGVLRSGNTMLARLAPPGGDFAAAENLGSQVGIEYAECLIDESGLGHAFYNGFGLEPTMWARLSAAGVWSSPMPLASPSGTIRGVNADRFGNLSLIYVEGSNAFALRYE